jgi:hypothetical protein
MLQIAGVEEQPASATAVPVKASQSQWMQQLEDSYGAAALSSSGPASLGSNRNTMVKVVGYNQESRAPAARASSYNAPDYGTGTSFGYDNIAGMAFTAA